MKARRAVVIGAGIGGLAAAVALQQDGWEVTTLERRRTVDPIGAGLSLWPNALRALDALGVEGMREGAALGGRSEIRTADGRVLARTDVGTAVRQRFGEPLILVHRSELIRRLLAALPDSSIHTGVTASVTAEGVVHSQAGDARPDLVVAADGIRSAARSALIPGAPPPRYAGYTTWRFVTDAPIGSGSESWGAPGERFAALPLADGRTYCYATASVPEGGREPNEATALRDRFGDWHDPIPALLAPLKHEDVIRTDAADIEPPTAFSAGPTVLLGDAAHAVTPDLGQGGCIALEDAVVLAACLRRASEIPQALADYTAERRPRAVDIAQRSRSAGRLYSRGPLLRATAARLMGALPPALVARGLTPVLDWHPPA